MIQYSMSSLYRQGFHMLLSIVNCFLSSTIRKYQVVCNIYSITFYLCALTRELVAGAAVRLMFTPVNVTAAITVVF